LSVPTRASAGSTKRILRLLGPGDPDHLDPASAYHIRPGQLLRVLSRQLFACRPTRDAPHPSQMFAPVPDVARALPGPEDGSLSTDQRTFTIRLRPDVWWDSTPPRTVTARDFVRGFKRLADPRIGGGRDFFAETVRGMGRYCATFDSEVDARIATADELARFHRTHDIAGVRAVGEGVLVIELTRPANDFLNLLTTGFLVAVPEEHDGYVPSSPELLCGSVSCGPYRVAGHADNHVFLERNPTWRAESDPIRRQVFDSIQVRKVAAQGPAAGRLDLAWSFGVVSWDAPDPDQLALPASYPGYTLNPYLVFNLHSRGRGAALRDVRVRRAIAYGVDKAAIERVFAPLDGVVVARQHSILAPGSVGHRPFNPYVTPSDRGAPGVARRLLTEAGYSGGLTLVIAVRDVGLHLAVAEELRRALTVCGVTLDVRTYPAARYYSALLSDPAMARGGAWDIAVPGWTPDWHGNNGRTAVAPLFRTDRGLGAANYGGYSNPAVDQAIDAALAERDPSRSADLWHEVDTRIMADVPVVPILAFACRCCAARTAARGQM
jgi:peptide/nickel transport system substrate-binding protein